MMHGRDVPVPDRMQGLPRDRRGYPVPDMIQRAADGVTPLFTANNAEMVLHHLANNLCGICGQGIEIGEFHMVGGPLSAFHPNGAYIDGPLHHECARYALQVCPYIAMPNYSKRIDPEKVVSKMGTGRIGVDRTMLPEKPECFVMLRCLSFNMSFPYSQMPRVVPVGDPEAQPGSHASRMLDYEVWKDGEEVTDERVAIGMVRVALQRAAAQQPQAPRLVGLQPVAGIDRDAV